VLVVLLVEVVVPVAVDVAVSVPVAVLDIVPVPEMVPLAITVPVADEDRVSVAVPADVAEIGNVIVEADSLLIIAPLPVPELQASRLPFVGSKKSPCHPYVLLEPGSSVHVPSATRILQTDPGMVDVVPYSSPLDPSIAMPPQLWVQPVICGTRVNVPEPPSCT
jgi:hypothetical protein